MPPDPIILYYTFNPGVPPPDRPSAWDVEVKMEDAAVKSRMAVIVQSTKESTQDLGKLDDEVDLSAILRRFDLTYSHYFRFRSLRSHCTTHTQSACFCKVLQTIQQNLSRHGWNRSRGIWRAFLVVDRAKVPPFVRRSFVGVISSGFPGWKKQSPYKKACVWLQSRELGAAMFVFSVVKLFMIDRDV